MTSDRPKTARSRRSTWEECRDRGLKPLPPRYGRRAASEPPPDPPRPDTKALIRSLRTGKPPRC